MRITNIKIQNFRSIKELDISISEFNVFVGQNNAGKTNLFEAIEFFYNGVARGGDIINLKHMRRDDAEIVVEIKFAGVQSGIETMQNATSKTKIKNKVGDADVITITRSSSDVAKRNLYLDGVLIDPGTGFDKALNDFLPKFEYIDTKKHYDSVTKYGKKTPIGSMLSGVLDALLQANDEYIDFQRKFDELFAGEESPVGEKFREMGNKIQSHLSKQFPDCTEVLFEVSMPDFDDLLKKFTTSINDGVLTDVDEKGDGMQRALMLAIIQAYSDFRRDNEQASKSFLFFIDEAELHLHPSAQRKLKNVLLDLAASQDQVFINTHSSVLISDNHDLQTIYTVEKNDKVSEVSKVSETLKPYIVYSLLGGTPSDLLLPDNFLIVEGKSEVELLTRISSRFYSDKPKVQILPARGDVDQVERSINDIEGVYTTLEHSLYGKKMVILLDCPSEQTEGSVENFKREHRCLENEQRLHILPKRDIEQCYPVAPPESRVPKWRRSQEEVDRMDSTKKLKLAKNVGNLITQEQFENESDLAPCFKALTRCWELARES